MILLLGATGYLGRAFAAELNERRIDFVPLSRRALDYTKFHLLFQYVRRVQPEFVINSAGYTGLPNIDACEAARAHAVQANTLLPQTVARVCHLTRTPWGHVSSGCIYSGARIAVNGGFRLEPDVDQPQIRSLFESQPQRFDGFRETDAPNFSFRSPPCSFYSGTKALAEESIHWADQIYIWRPRIVFDQFDHPRNLLSKLQAYAKVHDGVNSLTHRGDFVRACLDLWQRQARFGTYNIVNPGALTGRQIVESIQNTLKPNRPFAFWKDDEEFYRCAVRARRSNCILDASKLLEAGVRMRPVRAALQDALEHWQPAPWHEARTWDTPATAAINH